MKFCKNCIKRSSWFYCSYLNSLTSERLKVEINLVFLLIQKCMCVPWSLWHLIWNLRGFGRADGASSGSTYGQLYKSTWVELCKMKNNPTLRRWRCLHLLCAVHRIWEVWVTVTSVLRLGVQFPGRGPGLHCKEI